MLLLRQWFSKVLCRFEYITLRVIGEDGTLEHQAFQLLDLERRNIIVRPFMDLDDQAEQEGLYIVTAQPLHIWRHADLRQLPETLTTFVVHDPVKVDIITAIGLAPDSRKGVLAWKAQQSDVEDCIELHNKELLLERPMDLVSAGVPVLSLLDDMHARGFSGIDEVVHHTPAVRHYDRRRASARRPYFQCILHMEALAKKGVVEFHSGGSNPYFEALLRGKHKVRPGLAAIEYRRMLAFEAGDELALASLGIRRESDRTLATPKAGAKAKALQQPPQVGVEAGQPLVEDEERDEASVFGGSLPEIAVELGEYSHGPAAPSEPASVAGPAASIAASVRTRGALPPGVPTHILGAAVLFVPGRLSETHTYHDRITIRCTNSGHPKCTKSRSLNMLHKKYGARCAEAFLGAWLLKAESMEAKAHAKFAPKVSDMEAYLAAHP